MATDLTSRLGVPALAEPLHEAELPRLSAARRSLEQWSNDWQIRDLPAERATSTIPARAEQARAALAPAFRPAGPKATAVALDKLFSVLPLPNPDGLQLWIEMLENYPADVLVRAIDAVILTHRWANPPTIADVVERANADELHYARQLLRNEIDDLLRRIERDRAAAR